MRRLVRWTLTVALSLSCLLGPLRPGACHAERAGDRTEQHEFDCPCDMTVRGTRRIVETPNFRVSGEISRDTAVKIARNCERLRGALSAKWLPDAPIAAWAPRCDVLVHENLAHYISAVGRAGALTVGSADVSAGTSGELRRRIDLRGDLIDRSLAALPHEMTHVVLADAFGDKRPPLWADEGMAILADPTAKRRRHADDLCRALTNGQHFEPAELLACAAYPSSDRWGAYYGQSAAAVEFLVERKSAPDFLRFLAIADERGYDAALRQVYGLRDASALRAAWGPSVVSASARRK